MNCPSCRSSNNVKNGLLKETQRYKCKDCGCNYIRSYAHYQEKDRKRRLALSMYLEGLSYHSISRLLGVSHVSVLNWVRRYGSGLEALRNPRPCRVLGTEELKNYPGQDKIRAGFGLIVIEAAENTLICSWNPSDNTRKAD